MSPRITLLPKEKREAPEIMSSLELINMVLISKIALFLSNLNDAINDAVKARDEAREKYPNMSEE
jgi:hypothetical protein